MRKTRRRGAAGRGACEIGDFSAPRLTLREVVKTQRWAWRPAGSGDYPTYSFDGINFWWQPRCDEDVMVSGAVVPSDGWRHRVACNCELCASAARRPTRPAPAQGGS